MTWPEQIVAELARLKQRGFKFPDAWRLAVQRHPPSKRDLGTVPDQLFDTDALDEVPLPEFLRARCAEAWDGRRPELDRMRVLAEADVFPVADGVAASGRSRSPIAA
jgi:hypothetical protein